MNELDAREMARQALECHASEDATAALLGRSIPWDRSRRRSDQQPREAEGGTRKAPLCGRRRRTADRSPHRGAVCPGGPSGPRARRPLEKAGGSPDTEERHAAHIARARLPRPCALRETARRPGEFYRSIQRAPLPNRRRKPPAWHWSVTRRAAGRLCAYAATPGPVWARPGNR